MKIQIDGIYHEVITEQTLLKYMDVYFKNCFDKYLQDNYNIDEETFHKILLNIAPEEFI